MAGQDRVGARVGAVRVMYLRGVEARPGGDVRADERGQRHGVPWAVSGCDAAGAPG